MSEDINVGGVLEALNGKVDLDANNLSLEGKSLISGLGMPSNKYIDLTLGATGSTYTAPANGWFVLAKKSSANNQIASMIASNGVRTIFISNGSSQDAYLYAPVLKNKILQVFYNLGGATEMFRFIYAEGDK